jgi:transcription elongation GreA/GreB family factor
LEGQLLRARGTDFANAKTDAVSIGTVVNVTDLNTSNAEKFSVLGAWDSDPEKGVISYLTPVAQSLLNRKAGEEVEFDMEGAKKRYRIEAITAYKTA